MNSIAMKMLLASVALAPVAVMPLGGVAYAQTATRDYSIAAQDLGDALRQFGAQSGRDMVFDPALTAGKTSKGVNGRLGAEAALNTLLEGSGLSFTTTSAGFAVRSAVGNGTADGVETASSNGEGLAQSEKGIAEILGLDSQATVRLDARSTLELLSSPAILKSPRRQILRERYDAVAASVKKCLNRQLRLMISCLPTLQLFA